MPSGCGLSILLFAGVAFAQGDVTLSGNVTDAITHFPIAGAKVDWAGAFANTDAKGAWSLRIKPTDAEAEVTVSKAGYGGVNLIVPGLGAARTVDFKLHKAAHLSGRIVDRETGKPLAGFTVLATARQGPHPHSVFARFLAKPSAADGSFAILGDLNAGEYTLEIDPPFGARIVGESDKPDELDYVRSYFPDVARAEMAVPVTLSAGEDRDLELRLHKRDLHHIAGVLRVPDGLGSGAIAISLTADGRMVPPLASGEIPKAGTFRIDGLDEGSYHLDAAVKGADGVSAAFGGQVVEVSRHSIDDLKVTLRSVLTLRAHVVMAEDQAELPKGLQFSVIAFPAPFFAGVSSKMFIRLSKDRLSLEGYPAGEYWPTLKVPAGYAVTSVSFDGRSVNHSTVDFESSESVVSFTLTSRPASVAGTVRDGNQNAVPGAMVVLRPESLPDSVERFDRAAIHVMPADGNGAFRFTGLPPGKFRVIVLTAKDGERARDLGFLLGQESSPVELDFGQKAMLDLHRR